MNRYGGALAAATIAGLLVVWAAVAAPAIGYRTPFFTRGEPREALVVQTIVRGDGFVLPMRNGNELPSKPPFFHWLAAATSLAYGHLSEGSIRLPGLVASLAVMAATAAVAWSWWGPATSLLTTVVLATSFQWLASSVTARVDMILAAAIALALLLFARAVDRGRRIPVACYVLVAVATLTKGPIGLVLPSVIALVTLAARGELGFLGWRDLRLLALAMVLPALWYVVAATIGGDAFVAKQILKENVYRVLDPDSVEAGHVAPFWYYVPLLAAGLAPWSLFLPGLAISALSREPQTRAQTAEDVAAPETGTDIAESPAPAGPAAAHRVRDPHTTFALVWGTVTFVLFSAAGSKRAVYLLPAYPAYAMLVARGMTKAMEGRAGRAGVAALVAGAALVALLLVVISAAVLAGTLGIPIEGWLRGLVSDADVNNVAPMLEATREHRAVVVLCSAAMLAAAWALAAAARRGNWPRVVAATSVAMLALSATVSTTLMPALAARRSARSVMMHVSEKVPPAAALSFYRAFDYGAVFYRGRAIPVRQALSDVPEIDGAWLLTWPAFLADLKEEARRLGTGGAAAGAYEVEEVITSEDVDPSDKTTLVLVRIVRTNPPAGEVPSRADEGKRQKPADEGEHQKSAGESELREPADEGEHQLER